MCISESLAICSFWFRLTSLSNDTTFVPQRDEMSSREKIAYINSQLELAGKNLRWVEIPEHAARVQCEATKGSVVCWRNIVVSRQ